MKIGVLGAGNVGGGLAKLWEAKGHDVVAAGRDGIAEAAAHGEVVVLAVPAGAADEALAQAGSLEGKVLVDATNDLSDSPRESQAAHVASLASGARVVKAFNAGFAALYSQVQELEMPPPMVFCGDESASETVAELIRDAGYEPTSVGGLDKAPQVEQFARMIIGLAYGEGGRGPFVYRFETP